jgi:hypothetical protein
MRIKSTGIDLGETTFHVVALGTRSRYIFADCFSSNPILLAFRRRTIHISTTTVDGSVLYLAPVKRTFPLH